MDSLRELLPSAAVMVDQQPLKYTDAAQNTKPARVPAFLSVEEIKQVTSTIQLLLSPSSARRSTRRSSRSSHMLVWSHEMSLVLSYLPVTGPPPTSIQTLSSKRCSEESSQKSQSWLGASIKNRSQTPNHCITNFEMTARILAFCELPPLTPSSRPVAGSSM